MYSGKAGCCDESVEQLHDTARHGGIGNDGAPHRILQLVLAYRPVVILQQEDQQFISLRGELDRLPLPVHLTRFGVDRKP